MTRKIKVLIVDDSMVIRRLLSDTLSSEADIEIAGTAAHGKIALNKIPKLNPDVITLDMEMPEMDGITTLVEIRKLYPKLPVIMFSTLTHNGAEATLDAIAKGANDYVTKPANVGSVKAAMDSVRSELAPKIKTFCSWYSASQTKRKLVVPTIRAGTQDSTQRRISGLQRRIDIVAIGVSTGGPNALQTLLPALPATLKVPIVVVQHMPAIFTKHLADRLNNLSTLEIREARPGDTLGPGGVWIAPGDYHMTVRRNGTKMQIDTNQDAKENSCRPAVDVLFRSVAETYGGNVLSIVLTGMGQDGMKGCDAIRSASGTVIAQDEDSSVVWGMPGAVVAAGLADNVLPLGQIAQEIIGRTRTSNTTPSLALEC